MSTPAQIAANRANALKSTGPKSEEGKARSAMNALKSGLDAQSLLIPGESPQAFAQLIAEYYSKYAPADPEQRYHLDTAIRHEWLLRRFAKVEDQLWALSATRMEKPLAGLELGQAFDQDNKVMMRLHRRVAHSEKAYDRAMAAFHNLQAQQNTPESPELASFRAEPLEPQAPLPAAQPPTQFTPPAQPRASRGPCWTGNEPPAWRL